MKSNLYFNHYKIFYEIIDGYFYILIKNDAVYKSKVKLNQFKYNDHDIYKLIKYHVKRWCTNNCFSNDAMKYFIKTARSLSDSHKLFMSNLKYYLYS